MDRQNDRRITRPDRITSALSEVTRTVGRDLNLNNNSYSSNTDTECCCRWMLLKSVKMVYLFLDMQLRRRYVKCMIPWMSRCTQTWKRRKRKNERHLKRVEEILQVKYVFCYNGSGLRLGGCWPGWHFTGMSNFKYCPTSPYKCPQQHLKGKSKDGIEIGICILRCLFINVNVNVTAFMYHAGLITQL